MATKRPGVIKKTGKKSPVEAKNQETVAIPATATETEAKASSSPPDRTEQSVEIISAVLPDHRETGSSVRETQESNRGEPRSAAAPSFIESAFRFAPGTFDDLDLSYQPASAHDGDDARLVLMARDPNSAYAYWHLPAAGMLGIEHPLVLRLYQDTPGSESGRIIDEVDASRSDASSYFEKLRGEASYYAELGSRAADGCFTALLRSNPIATPRPRKPVAAPRGINSRAAAEFGVTEAEVRAHYRELVASLNPHRRPRTIKPAPTKTPLSSDQTGQAASDGAASSWVLGASEQHQRTVPLLFAEVEAEVVVFGRVQAGAHLTLDGVPVALRDDGSFSLRLAIPQGGMQLPFIAQGEGGQSRHIALTFDYNKREKAEEGVDESSCRRVG